MSEIVQEAPSTIIIILTSTIPNTFSTTSSTTTSSTSTSTSTATTTSNSATSTTAAVPPTISPTTQTDKHEQTTGIAAGVTVGICVILIGVGAILFFRRRARRQRQRNPPAELGTPGSKNNPFPIGSLPGPPYEMQAGYSGHDKAVVVHEVPGEEAQIYELAANRL